MKRLLALLFTPLFIIGCASQDDSYTKDTEICSKSFSVTIEDITNQDATRVHLDENLNVVLDNGNKIAVFDKNSAKSEYTYSDETEQFSGESLTTGEELNKVYALYPSTAAISCNEEQIEGIIPNTQIYEENSFAMNSHIMYAKKDNLEGELHLSNMVTYIKLQLYSAEDKEIIVNNITITTKGGESISGNFHIDNTANGTPTLTMCDECDGKESPSASATLDCSGEGGGGVTLATSSESATVFYIAMPVKTYSQGFTITVTDKWGRKFTKSASAELELKRNLIKPMPALMVDYSNDIQITKDNEGNYYVSPRPEHSLEDFLKWGYIANNIDNTLGIKLLGNVNLPAKVIAEDHENQTYIYTDTDITITDDVPSGSNWVPLGKHINGTSSNISNAFTGNIEGNNYKINGLRINKSGIDGAGLIGMFVNGSIKDLTIDDAYIHGSGTNGTENNEATGGVVAFNRHNTTIENVKVSNSHISGHNSVGGIVGHNYRRTNTSISLQYIIDCSTDNNTLVSGNSNIGGICGYNYGAALIHCTNSADVTGTTEVGGIAGDTRTYDSNKTNGYLIASVSTADANITATNGNAGGIAGRNWRNKDHRPSESYVVACCSFSNVSGSNAGSLIGSGFSSIHSGLVYSSFAEKKEFKNIVGHDQNSEEIFASEHFSSANEITTDFVNKMNAAIDSYNENVTDAQDAAIENVKCHYKWLFNANGWPTLVKDTQE